MMTGPGTNTYLLGAKETAVIDPGPAIAEQDCAEALRAADRAYRTGLLSDVLTLRGSCLDNEAASAEERAQLVQTLEELLSSSRPASKKKKPRKKTASA